MVARRCTRYYLVVKINTRLSREQNEQHYVESKMKSLTVTKMMIWLLSEYSIKASNAWVVYSVHICQFTGHYDGDAVQRPTFWGSDVTLLKQTGCYGLSASSSASNAMLKLRFLCRQFEMLNWWYEIPWRSCDVTVKNIITGALCSQSLCEATTQISWARNIEEHYGFWCRNQDKVF